MIIQIWQRVGCATMVQSETGAATDHGWESRNVSLPLAEIWSKPLTKHIPQRVWQVDRCSGLGLIWSHLTRPQKQLLEHHTPELQKEGGLVQC